MLRRVVGFFLFLLMVSGCASIRAPHPNSATSQALQWRTFEQLVQESVVSDNSSKIKLLNDEVDKIDTTIARRGTSLQGTEKIELRNRKEKLQQEILRLQSISNLNVAMSKIKGNRINFDIVGQQDRLPVYRHIINKSLATNGYPVSESHGDTDYTIQFVVLQDGVDSTVFSFAGIYQSVEDEATAVVDMKIIKNATREVLYNNTIESKSYCKDGYFFGIGPSRSMPKNTGSR